LETTRQLRERLRNEVTLRRICGWETAREVPSEATFSRAFAEFAQSQVGERAHARVIESYQKARLVGHIARDATAIEVRERAAKKGSNAEETGVSGPRRRKKKVRPTRLERQLDMTLEEMLADLPRACDCGTKRNSKGRQSSWVGYKLHVDVADGGIPISAILTSASVHDTQVAIPLATMTAARVTNLYDLMDKGYDAEALRAHSRKLGHVPLIDRAQRVGQKKVEWAPHEAQRFKERTMVERVYARLKDEFGGRTIRVRGAAKVMASLMFGLLALTADQLLRLAQAT
jgi:Transposase DDE domain